MVYSAKNASKQEPIIYNDDKAHEEEGKAQDTAPRSSKRSRPFIRAYTVQCAQCYKWRVVPTKQKYEELRESISQENFRCARAREWDRDLSCDDPEDVSNDGSRVWAVDKPDIPLPPPGWDRVVTISEASDKFADVHYTSPSGKKLRSTVDIKRYLEENPDYTREGVNLSQFSFAIPKPRREVNVPELPEVTEAPPTGKKRKNS